VSPAQLFIEATYLLASVLFILGLKGMSHTETARRGMFLAEAGMLAAIIGTLVHKDIVSYTWILAGLVIGGIIGALMAIWVPMTAMPQRTALSHAFGAVAAALVAGEAWRSGRKTLTACLVLSIVAGEGFALITGAERLLAAREERQRAASEINTSRWIATVRVETATSTLAATEAAMLKEAGRGGCKGG